MFPSLEIREAPDGADPGAVAAPLAEAPVLAGLQVVVAPPVVGMLIQQPVAVHHVAGVEVGQTETVHEVRAVVGQLHHLASHVEVLVQPHLGAAAVLRGEGGRSKGHNPAKCSFSFTNPIRSLCLSEIAQHSARRLTHGGACYLSLELRLIN